MTRAAVWLSCAAWAIGAGLVCAQQPGSAVQLPTWSSFTARSTVSVPDGGGVYLGGIKRGAEGRNEFRVPLLPFRPFKNVGIGSERSFSGMQVRATIHDFEAMDEALLSQPTAFSRSGASASSGAGRLAAGPSGVRGPVGRPMLTPSIAADAGRPAPLSVDEERARRVRQQQTRAHEAMRFFERGQQAETAGKLAVAKVYYEMASRRAAGELQGLLAARMAALGARTSPPQVAGTQP